MANDVFANGREISCKKADGKSICAFPDVCMTPPENPATPPGVPVPYPNTGKAKDMTSGSKKVKISGKEIVLKNKSYFKKSYGDEAGSAAKKGVVTSVNRGKVYFIAWSMDVKVEGKNAVRHLDMTTHNHASPISNTPPQAYLDAMATMGKIKECKGDAKRAQDDCAGENGPTDCSKDCKKAQKCVLTPKKDDKKVCCKPDTTGHHLFPNSLLQGRRGDSSTNVSWLSETYNENVGPCVCVSGPTPATGKHKELHDNTKEALRKKLEAGKTITYDTVKTVVAEAHSTSFGKYDPKCNEECIKKQIDKNLSKHLKEGATKKEVLQKDGVTRKKFDQYRQTGGV